MLPFLPAAQVAPFANVPFQPLPVTSFAVVPLVSLNGSFATGTQLPVHDMREFRSG